MTHEKREVRGGQWGKSTAVPCLSTLTWFVPPSVNFWLQYQRDTFPCTDTLKPTTTSGKTEDVSVTTALPIRSLGIFPTSYFVSFLTLSLSLIFFSFLYLSLPASLFISSFFFPFSLSLSIFLDGWSFYFCLRENITGARLHREETERGNNGVHKF